MPANELTVDALLRAHAPHAPDSLRARVAALEPVSRRRPARRFALAVVVAALLAAVGVALVHGLTTSSTPSARETVTGPVHWGAVAQPRPTSQHLAQQRTAVGSAAATAAGKAQIVTGSSGRLQHTDASLALQVASSDDVASATTRATRVATSLGGYAQSVRYASHGTAVLDLRIPTQNVQTAMGRLASLGTLVSQKISINDLQQRLQTQSDQIAQLRRRIAALETALRDPSLPDAQRVILQIRLAESKRALAQRLNARQGTITAGTMAHVAVRIGTKKAVAPAPPHRGRIGRMLHSAVGFLALEGMIALFALIVASPIALVAGLIWLWRRRSVDRLLAA